jgi:hypothetical protein
MSDLRLVSGHRDIGRIIAQPVRPFYDPRWGSREISFAREQRQLVANIAASERDADKGGA